jgi:hypothetical protein
MYNLNPEPAALAVVVPRIIVSLVTIDGATQLMIEHEEIHGEWPTVAQLLLKAAEAATVRAFAQLSQPPRIVTAHTIPTLQ